MFGFDTLCSRRVFSRPYVLCKKRQVLVQIYALVVRDLATVQQAGAACVCLLLQLATNMIMIMIFSSCASDLYFVTVLLAVRYVICRAWTS